MAEKISGAPGPRKPRSARPLPTTGAGKRPPPRPRTTAPAVRTPRGGIGGLIDRVDWVRVRERLTQYAMLARMHKPVGAGLLLWPTWWALWLAAGDFPPWGTLII